MHSGDAEVELQEGPKKQRVTSNINVSHLLRKAMDVSVIWATATKL